MVPGVSWGQEVFLRVPDLASPALTTASVAVTLENTTPFTAFQFDLVIPAGLAYVPQSAVLSSRASGSHSVAARLVTPGRLRVVAYDATGFSPFTGFDGTVVVFNVHTGATPGAHEIGMENIVVSKPDGGQLTTSGSPGTLNVVAPDIDVSALQLSFGDVPLQSSVTLNLDVTNRGTSPLTISNVLLDGTALDLTDLPPGQLPPGGVASLGIRFRPLVKGRLDGSLRIESSDPDEGSITVRLTGRAFAVNEVSLGTAVGVSGDPMSLVISVDNMEPFVGLEVNLRLPDIATYVPESVVLATGRKNDHQVAARQIDHDLIILAYSTSGRPFLGSSGEVLRFDLRLEGDGGTYPVEVTSASIADANGENILSAFSSGAAQIAAPVIELSSQNLDFGPISSIGPASRELTIANHGSSSLTIHAIDSSPNELNHGFMLPLVIPSGASASADVTVVPVREGRLSGVLRIRSDDAPRNPQFVHVEADVFIPVELDIVDSSTFSGDPAFIEIELGNYRSVSALQFDLSVPDEFTLDLPRSAVLRSQQHVFVSSPLAGGTSRILVYSPSGSVFSGQTGVVVRIPFSVPTGWTGAGQINLANVYAADTAGRSILTGFQGGTATVLTLDVTKAIDFDAGWSLRGLSVVPSAPSPADLFDPMGGDLVYATSFSCQNGAIFYLPGLLPALNSLNRIDPGQGFWVKTHTATATSIAGRRLPSDFSVDLCSGWNLVGFWPATAVSVRDALAPLISNGSLEYATGFSALSGALLFDPDGFEFFNTLTTLASDSGYWLKLASPFDGFRFAAGPDRRVTDLGSASKWGHMLAESGVVPTPDFVISRGRVLPDAQSTQDEVHLDVRDSENRSVGYGIALSGRYQLVAYHPDPAAVNRNGQPWELTVLSPTGKARLQITDLALPAVIEADLQLGSASESPSFPSAPEVQAYPNPASSTLTLHDRSTAPPSRLITVYDLLGRRVLPTPLEWPTSASVLSIDTVGWAPGLYLVRVETPDSATSIPVTVMGQR